MNNNLKERAITLIALVITIVVLIILVGVAISLSLGENGLFKKVKTATEEYTNAQRIEEKEMADLEYQIDMNSRETVTIPKEEYEELKSKYQRTGSKKLFSTTTSIQSGNITLNEDVKNFDYIVVTGSYDNRSILSNTIMRDDIFYTDGTKYKYELAGYDTRYICFDFLNGTTIRVSGAGGYGIISVYGFNVN